MKVNKFSENTKNELIDSINNKEYVIEVYDKNRIQVYSGGEKDISKATERYYEFTKDKDYNDNGTRYIFLIEKESKVLTEEEIEMLNSANKYNL